MGRGALVTLLASVLTVFRLVVRVHVIVKKSGKRFVTVRLTLKLAVVAIPVVAMFVVNVSMIVRVTGQVVPATARTLK